jgi:branched-chain amino acid transport system ATP-binding protein
MTVLGNVMVGMHPRTKSGFLGGTFHLPGERREEKQIKKRAEALLERFELLPRAEWRASHISIAEQKRLEIARAMAAEPAILLLDEPAAGLNIRETEVMGDLILRLKGNGQTVIRLNITCIWSWVFSTVIVLHHGSKIGEGRPEDVQKDNRSWKPIWGRRRDRLNNWQSVNERWS